MAAQQLYLITYDNCIIRVSYDKDAVAPAPYITAEQLDQPPVVPQGEPQRDVPVGQQIYQQREGNDRVTIVATDTDPYAVRAAEVDYYQPSTLSLQVEPDASAKTATLLISGGVPPYYTKLDAGLVETQFSLNKTFYSDIVPGNRTATVKDSTEATADAGFFIAGANTGGGPGQPVGAVLHEFDANNGDHYKLIYQTAEQSETGARRIVTFRNPQTNGELASVTPAELGYQEGDQVGDGLCEGFTRVRFFATLGNPFLTIQTEENSTTCGYVPPGGGGGDNGGGGGGGEEPDEPGISLFKGPSNFAPVHLPVLFTFLAEPDAEGNPQEVLCFIDTRPSGAVPWQYCGVIRRTPGSNKLVQFNLSEFLKSRFTIVPPVAGLDDTLSLRYRVRLGFAPAFTGTLEAEELRIDSLRVVNATVPNAGNGTYLSDLLPLPEGFPYRLSKLGISGVTNTTTNPGVAPAPCPPWPLHLVWLNQKGGWDGFVFAGKHEYGTDTADGQTWVDAQGADRFASVGSVRKTVNVYSDRLDPHLAAKVRTIRSSVQVYEVPPTGPLIPVLVQQGSFTDYRAADKVNTVDFTISYPRQAVQTQ